MGHHPKMSVSKLKRSDSKHSFVTTTTVASESLTSPQCTLSQYSMSSATVALRNLIYLQEWTDVISICISNPYEAKVTDRMGDLPIHEACLHGAPFDVIESLWSAYPCGIKKKGFCGRLPLHYAVYNKPYLNTVKFLLEKYPVAASTMDSDGRLPIHLAVVRNAPKHFIETLITANPQSVRTPNKFGNTPQMLARNDYVYSVLNCRKDVQRTALHRIDNKINSPTVSHTSKTPKTKKKVTANTLRQNINKARSRNTPNASRTRNALPNDRQRQPRTRSAYPAKYRTKDKKHVTPCKSDQMQALELPNRNFSGRTVSSELPSKNIVSKIIQKHETKIMETTLRRRINMNKMKSRTLLCPVVAVT